jgi:hypothetical protein
MVAPAAHQGGTARRTLGRGPPRSRARRPLERGPPRSKAPTCACSHLRVRALNALTPQGRATTLTRLGITPQRCSTNSLGGTHPRHCGALCDEAGVSSWHCAAHSCTANTPSPRRGPTEPSNALSVTTQGQAMTSGRRERSSPSLSTLCGHPCPCSATPRTAATTPTLLERTGVGRRHTRRCTSYGPPSTAPLDPVRRRRPDGQPLRLYPRSRSCLGTGRAATPAPERDSPGRLSAPRHCSPRLHT